MSDTAWTAILGILGIASAIFGIWLGAWMSRNQSREQADDARDSRVREVAVDGYTAAIEATRWLSVTHVEDSVDPQFSDEYRPKTDAAVQRLRHAATQFTQVSALSRGPELAKTAGEVSLGLALLDEAWHSAQEYRRRLNEARKATNKVSPVMQKFNESQFDKNFRQLERVREQLIGFDGSLNPEEELSQGGLLEDSLLYRVRTQTSAAKLP